MSGPAGIHLGGDARYGNTGSHHVSGTVGPWFTQPIAPCSQVYVLT